MWPEDPTSEDLVDERAVLWRKYHPTLETCGDETKVCVVSISFVSLFAGPDAVLFSLGLLLLLRCGVCSCVACRAREFAGG